MMLADVCVLVAAARPDHPFHAPTLAALNKHFSANRPMAWSGHLLAGMVRILINPRVWPGGASSLDEALLVAEQLSAYPAARYIAPGPEHWRITRDLSRAVRASSADLGDAFHAALAIEHGCEFWTLDRDFSRYPGLKVRQLQAG